MFRHIGVREQLVKERQKNAALQAQLATANSNIEYLAMMADIDMEQGEDEGVENVEEEQV